MDICTAHLCDSMCGGVTIIAIGVGYLRLVSNGAPISGKVSIMQVCNRESYDVYKLFILTQGVTYCSDHGNYRKLSKESTSEAGTAYH